MANPVFPRYDYRVQPREVDLTKKATIIALGDYILHTAGEDADRIGFGIRQMQSDNTTWVLSRMAIEVERFPDEYESYTIATWVSEINRLMTTRNFIVEDAQGRRIAAATTNWAMIDMRTRQPLDLRDNIRYSEALIPVACPIDRAARIARIGNTLRGTHRIRYSDIDFNQHTNSMKYIQWMIDTLPLEKLTDRKMKRLDINFIHETRFGEQVTIFGEETPEADLFEIKLDEGDTPVCKASFRWGESQR